MSYQEKRAELLAAVTRARRTHDDALRALHDFELAHLPPAPARLPSSGRNHPRKPSPFVNRLTSRQAVALFALLSLAAAAAVLGCSLL